MDKQKQKEQQQTKYYEPKNYNSLTGLPAEPFSSTNAGKFINKGLKEHYVSDYKFK